MSLSPDLVSQFVKITNDNKKQDTKKENITYGIVQEVHGDEVLLKLDGASDENSKLPATTTVAVNVGDRVIVMIKNHSAFITGNLGNPATTTEYVDGATGEIKQIANNANTNANEAVKKVVEFQTVITERLDTDELVAKVGNIDNLTAGEILAGVININTGNIDTLDVNTANIEKALVKEIDAETGEIKYAKIDNLYSGVANIENALIKEVNAETGEIKYAKIEELETNKLDADSADIRYAKIDFTNIEQTAIATLFATSGIIENVTMENGSITGHLVGVTISGDLIEGNTIKAEKLVIKGDDGLYYKLNTDGVKTEAEQTEYNSLNGSVIAAKSITATKIDVSDLVAFGATIGGFNISTESLYSGIKESVDNPAQGIFVDREGQLSLGDENNYIRYFKDDEGNWRLEISAENILFGANAKSSANDIKTLTEHVKIGVYNDNGDEKPCVELSEGDSYFKQIITNDKTMFTDGSIVRTQIDAEGVTSENITVGNEYRQGGFVWKARANGNLGLVWKGGNG